VATLAMRQGWEGPRHDPYGYTDFVWVDTGGHARVVYHQGGLAEWCEVRDLTGVLGEVQLDYATGGNAVDLFRCYTGLTPVQAVRAWYKRRARCKCGWRQFRWERGYPGETLQVCTRCGNVVDTDFDESAII
jgi:hypothetical protein